MSYTAGEALVLTAVQACTGFSATNANRGNWSILNKGKSDHYAIVHLGNAEAEFVTVNRYQVRYTTVIEIWQRYTDDGTSVTNLYTHLGNIVTGVQPYRRLSDTTGNVIDAGINGIGEVEEMWATGGGPAWLRVKVSLQWIDEIGVTFS